MSKYYKDCTKEKCKLNVAKMVKLFGAQIVDRYLYIFPTKVNLGAPFQMNCLSYCMFVQI